MLENKTDQVQAADTPTQGTKTFIRQVRSATRRKYAPEDKIRKGLADENVIGNAASVLPLVAICITVPGQFHLAEELFASDQLGASLPKRAHVQHMG